ncbi:hypothetical protein FM076_01775 [Streptomyces albus subsp. chlorinus]|uniref:hypothetical protein n=1 Tax=Streptomyces albus TaxID=1888 RepID=UPI00157037CF|nr:hypothetical protein [Streptomyces albus]NSC20003.1 hypothetical protein [Streptomyces albus subsp. chlorinus]
MVFLSGALAVRPGQPGTGTPPFLHAGTVPACGHGAGREAPGPVRESSLPGRARSAADGVALCETPWQVRSFEVVGILVGILVGTDNGYARAHVTEPVAPSPSDAPSGPRAA